MEKKWNKSETQEGSNYTDNEETTGTWIKL